MMPMDCPKCGHAIHRAVVTNGKMPDQTVRKRVCEACRHIWYTVEVAVPSYAVGWSPAHQHKPVLRVPMELTAGHTRLGVSHVEAQHLSSTLRKHEET